MAEPRFEVSGETLDDYARCLRELAAERARTAVLETAAAEAHSHDWLTPGGFARSVPVPGCRPCAAKALLDAQARYAALATPAEGAGE